MSTAALELPLFPLDVVLFPGTALPLHIFEPRYRQMIADCVRDELPIGIVLARPESEYLQEVPYSIGTMAEIRNLDHLPDGRYTLIAVGTRRFRIINQHHQKPYLSASVEPIEDAIEPTSTLLPPMGQASSLFNTYLDMLLETVNEENDLEMGLPEEPESLSYCVAYFLDIQNEAKQRLLELTSTQERLHEEISILRREVPFMRKILSQNLPEERSKLN
jgi:Lon protease-like protein